MRRLWAVYQGETKIATFDNKEGAKICQQRVGGEIVQMVEAEWAHAEIDEARRFRRFRRNDAADDAERASLEDVARRIEAAKGR